MKHQYFGDVNDFVKYGLLRALGAAGVSVTACWMLTPYDPVSRDGRRLGYLKDDRWRVHDPELYDFLRGRRLHEAGVDRHVRIIEDSGLLPGVRFFSDVLPDDRDGRRSFFARLEQAAAGSQVVFFDPDNGLEVKSVPKGRRRSSKYLYWDEFEELFRAGHSIVAFQHFARLNRGEHVAKLVAEARQLTNADRIWPLRCSHAVFLLVARREPAAALGHAVDLIGAAWQPRIRLADPST